MVTAQPRPVRPAAEAPRGKRAVSRPCGNPLLEPQARGAPGSRGSFPPPVMGRGGSGSPWGGRPGGGGWGGPRGGRMATPDKPDEGLPKIADATGGGYFELTTTSDLASTFKHVADELHVLSTRTDAWQEPIGGLAKLAAATLTVEKLTLHELAGRSAIVAGGTRAVRREPGDRARARPTCPTSRAAG